MTPLGSKVVLITGGAAGIGAEVARRLHAKGAKLVLTDLDKAKLDEIRAELGEEWVLTVVAECVSGRPCRPPSTRPSNGSVASTS
jgi:NADP-dependent 3-hydroxy acid dehydrogenase YdfG